MTKDIAKAKANSQLKARLLKWTPVYLMMVPGALYLLINNYFPIIGLVLCILQAAMFLFTGQIASYGISGVLSLVFVAVLVFLAFKIEKEGKQA